MHTRLSKNANASEKLTMSKMIRDVIRNVIRSLISLRSNVVVKMSQRAQCISKFAYIYSRVKLTKIIEEVFYI